MSDMKMYSTKVQESEKKLNLVYSIITTYQKESSAISKEYEVGGFALVRFKFHQTGGRSIATSVSLKLHSLQEHSNTQIEVTCKVGGEVKQFVCPQVWTEFEMHQTTIYILNRDSTLVFAIPIEITVDTSIPKTWSNLHSDDSFTDFHLISENGSVPVHRVVMAQHSEVFKTMLNGEWKETAKHCLEVEGVTQQTLQHLKDYMYLGSLPEHEDLRPLLLIAKCYMMQRLEGACIAKLVLTVTPENYQDTLEFAIDNRLLTLISSMVKNVPAKIVEDSEALTNQQLKAKE